MKETRIRSIKQHRLLPCMTDRRLAEAVEVNWTEGLSQSQSHRHTGKIHGTHSAAADTAALPWSRVATDFFRRFTARPRVTGLLCCKPCHLPSLLDTEARSTLPLHSNTLNYRCCNGMQVAVLTGEYRWKKTSSVLSSAHHSLKRSRS